MRGVLVDFGERHRHTNKRAALHRSRPPADQSGKRVASWTGEVAGHARLATDMLARMSRGCYAENGPIEFKLYRALGPELIPVYRQLACR